MQGMRASYKKPKAPTPYIHVAKKQILSSLHITISQVTVHVQLI
jgi:hypothetical protein